MPASTITSASPSFATVMPLAPAASCICASIGDLCVLVCGRSFTPARAATPAISSMLRSTTSRSNSRAGVSRSAYTCVRPSRSRRPERYRRRSWQTASAMPGDSLRPLWDFDDLDATESRLREALAGVDDDPSRAEILTQLARVEGLRDNFEAGDALID